MSIPNFIFHFNIICLIVGYFTQWSSDVNSFVTKLVSTLILHIPKCKVTFCVFIRKQRSVSFIVN